MLGESGYERRALDAYWTPTWCTEALLEAVALSGPIWEPACGLCHISKVLLGRGYCVEETDIEDRGARIDRVSDFLDAPAPFSVRFDIVTNPPYGRAEEFVRRALALTRPLGGKVAMLLRNEYDCAATRNDLFSAEPFALKLVLTRRPRWSDDDKASPRHNFAWFVWDWSHRGPARIAYGPRAA